MPLIDIMFFLLASFMLVSLSMVNLKSVKVNLPTATTASTRHEEGLRRHLDRQKRRGLSRKQASAATTSWSADSSLSDDKHPKLRVFISGDKDARHGDVIRVLDLVRSAGIEKVAFEIRPARRAGSMNRILTCINLIGVIALAVLCFTQWQTNSQLDLRLLDLEKTNLAQARKINEQQEVIRNNTTERDDLCDRLERAGLALKQVQDNSLPPR